MDGTERSGASARRLGYRQGVVDAFKLPVALLLASMMGFGSMAREAGVALGPALGLTGAIYGLPGQVAFVDMTALGAGLAAAVLASSLANARFLPMAVSFLPLVRHGLPRTAPLYLMVQLLSVNSWAHSLRSFPGLPGAAHRPYFVAMGCTCFVSALVGTAVGYLLVSQVPHVVTLGLLFLNPLYFAILFVDARRPAFVLAVAIGAVAGPLLYLVDRDWAVPVTGVVGGTLAFALVRLARRLR